MCTVRDLCNDCARKVQTFAAANSRSIVSLAHFKFIAPFGKSSHEILKYPCSAPLSSDPRPESAGASGVQRGPARTLNL